MMPVVLLMLLMFLMLLMLLMLVMLVSIDHGRGLHGSSFGEVKYPLGV